MKVLIQSRVSTHKILGGDTTILKHLPDELRKLGVDVTLDLDGEKTPHKFDLVHYFNFMIPNLIKMQAEEALDAGVPYVATALYEDTPMYHNLSRTVSRNLIEYFNKGQSPSWYAVNKVDRKKIPGGSNFNSEFVANNAALVFSSGEKETKLIKQDYPECKIRNIPFGVSLNTASPKPFIDQYNMENFVLCVGRIEVRKNQLMLLKALEFSDLPIVFIGGTLSKHEDYVKAVKKFKRKAPTLLIERVEPEILASAYRACKIHVLPSWYELPGLVSLEAYASGKNVVVTDQGTIRDYLQGKAYYTKPHDEFLIYQTVREAWKAPPPLEIERWVEDFSWANMAKKTYEAYQEVI